MRNSRGYTPEKFVGSQVSIKGALARAVLEYNLDANSSIGDLLWEEYQKGASVAQLAAAAELKSHVVVSILRKQKKLKGVTP